MQGEPIEQGVGALNISTVSNGTAPLPRCRPPFNTSTGASYSSGPLGLLSAGLLCAGRPSLRGRVGQTFAVLRGPEVT